MKYFGMPFPERQISNSSKMKEFADDNVSLRKMVERFF